MNSDPASDRRLFSLFNACIDLDAQARERHLQALREHEPEMAEALQRLLENDQQDETGESPAISLQKALESSALTVDAALPQTLGAYRIEGKLGQGGMGVVYLARRSHLAESPQIALKLMSERLRSAAAIERFLVEQRSLARLDHPGICRFIDADTLPDGRPMVVMEAIHGVPVDEYVAKHPLTLRQLLQLFLQLLAAVSHAHERLIVHRDIKCSNVLVSDEGQVKLLDFGIAKLIGSAQPQITATADRFMTLGITSPEYFSRGEVSVSTDIYALGALFYRLLTGRDPLQFEGMKPAEAERQLLFVEPPPLTETGRSRFQGAIGRDLEAVVHKCLRKSPAERYPSAESLAADLRRLLEGYPVLARPAPLLYRARLFASRHRAAVLAAAAAALGLLMWALSLSLSLREVERQRAEAVSAREASDTIAQILQSAIIEADPARRSIESIGAPEIMAAAAARLEPLERSNPAAFARLALLISRIELEYGRNREAHALALRGLERAEPATLANDLRERLRLIAALSAVRLGDNERAGALLDAIELDATSTDPLVTLARARLLLESTESKHAVELLQTALAAPGADDPKLLTSHELRWQLSDALSYSSNKAAALNVLDETLRWQSTHLPARHAWILDTRIKRLALLDPSTPQAELESEEHQVLAEVLDLYGSDSTLEAFVRGQIGYARYARRDLEGGVEQLSESVRIRRNTKGISDPGYLRAVTNLGIMLLELGQDAAHAEAVEVLIPAETEATRQFGAISPLALYMRTILAKAMVRGGRATEALALLSRSDAAEAHTVPSENNRRAQLEATNEVLSSDACSTPDLSPPIACLRLAERQRTLEAGLRPP